MNILNKVKGLWIKYMFILTPSQKRWGIVVAIMTLLGAGMETLGVSAILPLIQVIMNPSVLSNNDFFARFFQIMNITNQLQMIWMVCAGVILIYVMKNSFLLFLTFIRSKYSCKVQRELSVEMMRSYLNRGYPFFLDINTGVILRGMTTSISGTYESLFNLFKILAEVLTIICICIYLFMLDSFLAICVMGLASMCLLLVMFGFKRWMQGCGEKEYKYNAAINKTLLQTFQGVKEVLVMHKQNYFTEKYEKQYIERQKPAISKVIATESPAYIIEAVCVTGLLIAVCAKANGIEDSTIFVSRLASFAVGAFRILPSLGRISSSFNQVVFYKPGLDETYDNFKEVRESKYNNDYEITNEKKEKKIISLSKELIVNSVKWTYNNQTDYVLDKLQLTIKKGQSVALIGQSGAGKTTLGDIILGLLKPQEGQVLLDNDTDIYKIPEQWSHIVGFVPQGIYLTDDTIRNNIGFGVDEDKIEDEKVWLALEQAQLKEFVEKLPQQLENVIGERGVRFSGGQRQRIAIARALYQNPDILVLDEATSALDNETERTVMEAIDKLQGNKTLIIIAHRITTVKNCDVIYEIKNGKAKKVDKKELFASNDVGEGIDEN